MHNFEKAGAKVRLNYEKCKKKQKILFFIGIYMMLYLRPTGQRWHFFLYFAKKSVEKFA